MSTDNDDAVNNDNEKFSPEELDNVRNTVYQQCLISSLRGFISVNVVVRYPVI